MRCPHCAAVLPEASPVCAACGRLVETVSRIVRLEFLGTGLETAGWIVLCVIGAVLIVPMPWVLAAMGRWFCRKVEASDGTTAEFTGTGGAILPWWLLYIIAIAIAQSILKGKVEIRLGLSFHLDFPPFHSWQDLMRSLALTAISAAFAIQAIRWAVRHVRLSSGLALDFTGEYHGLLGWCLLYELSLLTIVGWAWVLAGMWRWIARQAKGENLAFEFHGEGHQILWRSIVAVVMCLPVVTIPWVWVWFQRWVVRNVTESHGIHAENWVAAG